MAATAQEAEVHAGVQLRALRGSFPTVSRGDQRHFGLAAAFWAGAALAAGLVRRCQIPRGRQRLPVVTLCSWDLVFLVFRCWGGGWGVRQSWQKELWFVAWFCEGKYSVLGTCYRLMRRLSEAIKHGPYEVLILLGILAIGSRDMIPDRLVNEASSFQQKCVVVLVFLRLKSYCISQSNYQQYGPYTRSLTYPKTLI